MAGRPASPIVGAALTSDGGGYWLLSAGGHVDRFGNARYLGSLPRLASGVTAVALMPYGSGNGYWVATSTGAVTSFGKAPKLAGTGTLPTGVSLVAGVTSELGDGIWLLESNGDVAAFGKAENMGNPAGTLEARPMSLAD